MEYKIFFANQGVAKTGLSPVFDYFKKTDGTDPTNPAPTISEVGSGFYKFDYTVASGEEVVVLIDANDATMPNRDRYISALLTPYDPYLDAKVSDVKTETDKIQTIDDNVDLVKTETDKIQTVDDNVDAVKAKTDNLPTDPASEANLSAVHGSGSWEGSVDLSTLEADVAIIKKIETGRWKIVNNQMIFYDDDGVTPLYTFNLKDASGNATEIQPKERVPV